MKTIKFNKELKRGMCASDYHNIYAASSSRLKAMRKTPAHCKALETSSLDNKALKFGEAFHQAVLEPELFEKHWEVTQKYKTTTKPQMLGYQEAADLAFMAESLKSFKLAHALVETCTEKEVSAFWTDPEAGAKCKLRCDGVAASLKICFDLKTTKDASMTAFKRDAYKLGYHIQGAFYIDGLRACGIDVDHFAILAVEKTAPYCTAVYRLTDSAIECGRAEYQALLKQWKHCDDNNDWPGYPETIQDLDLPEWAYNKIEAGFLN